MRYLFLLISISILLSCTSTSIVNKKFIYEVELRDSLNTIISKENIVLFLADSTWEFDNKQLTAIYGFDTSTVIPKELGTGYFCLQEEKHKLSRVSKDETGYVFDDNHFWIHPIRSNQYRYTEIAPFPSIKFNVKVGSKWNTNKSIGEGWCELAGETKEVYTLKDKNKRINGIKCYWVSASSKHSLGDSFVDFYFSKKKGLVLSQYNLVKGYKLDIILKK